MPNLVGIGLSQVPTNSMLGGLAYQDPEHASIKNLDLKNLSQINSEIADTAVDIFVYDTSKDSDGGAWRKRTTYTSWYNETLGTATRGSRKEFPAVAVIVAESGQVIIYDGDDPDLPMWMVFTGSLNPVNASGKMIFGTTHISCTSALNGTLMVGASGQALSRINFISDGSFLHWATNVGGNYRGNISERNNDKGYDTIGIPLVGNSIGINDVAMTVLPNAPVDTATGLPVPTIAVATDAGMSMIKDDGIVVDMYVSGESDQCLMVDFTDSNDLAVRLYMGWVFYYSIPSADVTSTYWNGVSGYKGRWTDTERDWGTGTNGIPVNVGTNGITELLEDKAIGHTNGLEILQTDLDSFENGMHAGISKDFNTGWMHGDIKGAFLSDTDTTNVTGIEKIANYNFAADFSTQWEAQNNANTSYDAANDRVTVTSTQNYSGITLKNASLPTLTEGKRYIMTVDIHSITNPIRFGVVSGGTKDSVNSTGSHTLVFTAQASVSEVYVQKPSGSNSTFVLNSVSIREAEEDRSVNNNGLQVFGTVTKSAVATGAELVAYSGFSASNYFKQPYNSDMDFGTGDLSVIFWYKMTSSSTLQCLLHRGDGGTGTWGSGNLIQIEMDGVQLEFQLAGPVFSPINQVQVPLAQSVTGEWQHFVGVRKGGRMHVYIDGVKYGNTASTQNVTNTAATTWIGQRPNSSRPASNTSMTLFRMSATAPSEEQVKKIYEDEKFLFQENAKATLYGSSDAVTALAFDEVTDQLHVGTSSGRSDFQALRRINNTTTAVTTAISAHDEFIIEQ